VGRTGWCVVKGSEAGLCSCVGRRFQGVKDDTQLCGEVRVHALESPARSLRCTQNTVQTRRCCCVPPQCGNLRPRPPLRRAAGVAAGDLCAARLCSIWTWRGGQGCCAPRWRHRRRAGSHAQTTSPACCPPRCVGHTSIGIVAMHGPDAARMPAAQSVSDTRGGSSAEGHASTARALCIAANVSAQRACSSQLL
jgi:hypothetical protein